MISPEELLSIPHVAASIGGTSSIPFTGISTDSRSVQPGEVFVAIRGEKFDGHNYIEAAVSRGAAAVVVDQQAPPDVLSARSGMVVPDTTVAYGQLASLYRKKFEIPVIAVAGSNGKTTTKEMIASVLETRFSVLKTEGNLNNHIGVPRTLFQLNSGHDIAVVEIGTNHPGEIRYLCSILEPTHGVITNIGREHLEFFRSVNGVAKEEGELFTWLRKHSGKAFVNADDRRVIGKAKGLRSSVTYGFTAARCSVRGDHAGIDESGRASFDVKPRGKKPYRIQLHVPGAQAAENGLAAAAVGMSFGVSAEKIRKALSQWPGLGKRMETLTAGGVTILNDTYNANPDSVIAALVTLRSMPCTGKKILILADMLELGDAAVKEHELIGDAIAKMGFEFLLTFGKLARLISSKANIRTSLHYDQKNMLSEYAAELLSAGDVVLVKGSRGMRMEDVVLFLTERLQGRERGR